MSTAPSVQISNPHARIGMQFIAERMFFGGKEPAPPEREALRGQVSQRFAEAVERGELGLDASMEIGAALERLLGPRGKWLETPGCRLASVEVEDDDREDLRLPLELLRPPTGTEPVLVRCALATTKSAPEGPRGYPEGGRIVLATADAGGPVPDEALGQALHEVCRTGLHLASGSEHDRKRGAFEPALDHVPRVSRAALRQALGPRDGRPGAAVLELVCHVREQGLCLHDDDSGQEVVVGAEALAAVLAPFVSHLRLVVLVPVAERPEGDPGRTLVDVALALHRRGLAAVVAPRVPLPAAASSGLTTALVGALLGNAEVAPASLERALIRANGYLSTKDRLAHLGLRLWARAADGHDTRPLVIRPYRGLLSFEPEHARFYLGRRAETTQVVERLAQLLTQGQPRLVLLVGASGVGKSSLAKAGVVPALAKQGWAAILTRPAQHSGEELEALVEAQAGERRLVVVDQLEEVLIETDSHHEASKYLQRLWGLAAKEGVAVVATLRIDALDRGAEVRVDAEGRRTLEQLVPGTHAVFVHHLDEDALREVIAEPARHVGLGLDRGLVDRLCAEALAEPGALPMLELVLDELWSRREGRRMVAADYEGGLAKRLADYANKCVAELPNAQREQAQRILVRIATGPVVELATWRRRTTVEALRPYRAERRAAFDAALAALVEARLVVRGDLRHVGSKEGDDSEHVAQAVESVELAHELLLRQWDALHGWIQGAAKQLAAVRDLERWVADHRKHETTLLTPQQLVYIEQAELPADGDDLNGAMVDLIDISRRTVRNRKRLRRVFVSGVGVVAVAFAGLSYWAREQRQVAERERNSARELEKIAQEKEKAAQNAAIDADRQRRKAEAQRLMQIAETEKDEPHIARMKMSKSAALMDIDNEMQARARRVAYAEDVRNVYLATPVITGIVPIEGAHRWIGGGQAEVITWSPSESSLYIVQSDGSRRAIADDIAAKPMVAWDPDGYLIIAAQPGDSTARIVSVKDADERYVLSGHKEEISSIAWSPDGQLVLTSSNDSTVRIWNRRGEIVQVMDYYDRGRITRATWHPDGRSILAFYFGLTKRAAIWELGSTTEKHYFEDGLGLSDNGAWSPNGDFLLVSKHDVEAGPTTNVLSKEGLRVAASIHFEGLAVLPEWEPNGNRFVLLSNKGGGQIWRADGSKVADIPCSMMSRCLHASWSPDGSAILVVGSGGNHANQPTAMVLSGDGSESVTFASDHLTHGGWSPDGTRVITYTNRDQVDIWDRSGRHIFGVIDEDRFVEDGTWSPDGRLILTLSRTGDAHLWENTGKHRATLRGHTARIQHGAWNAESSLILTSSDDDSAAVWNIQGEELMRLEHDADVKMGAWSRDGRWILTVSESSTMIWDTEAERKEPHAILTAPENYLTFHAAWSPDGQQVLTASGDRSGQVWTRDGRLAATLRGHTKHINHAEWSPDGQLIATGSGDDTVRIWSNDGVQVVVMDKHPNEVEFVSWRPDGEMLYSGSFDGTICVWRRDGSMLSMFEAGGLAPDRRGAWSPDGRLFLTSSLGGPVRIWSPEGTLMASLDNNYGLVLGGAWSSDGSMILTVSDREVLVWPWSMDSLLQKTESLEKPFDANQCHRYHLESVLDECRRSAEWSEDTTVPVK